MTTNLPSGNALMNLLIEANMTSGRRRVVVTGMGMVTPVGRDLESSWKALREGRGGVGPITLFDASTFADPDRGRGEGLLAR